MRFGALLSLFMIACTGGGSEITQVDAGSSKTPTNENPPTQETPPPPGTGGSNGTSGFVSPNPPPGCTDGSPRTRFFIVDATHIRITSLEGPDALICANGGTKDCAFPRFDALLTVPSTAGEGTWTLPSSDVTLSVIKEFPIKRASTGCTCEAEIATPRPITSGSIKLEQRQPDAGLPYYTASIEIENVAFTSDGSSSATGKLAALVGKCN